MAAVTTREVNSASLDATLPPAHDSTRTCRPPAATPPQPRRTLCFFPMPTDRGDPLVERGTPTPYDAHPLTLLFHRLTHSLAAAAHPRPMRQRASEATRSAPTADRSDPPHRPNAHVTYAVDACVAVVAHANTQTRQWHLMTQPSPRAASELDWANWSVTDKRAREVRMKEDQGKTVREVVKNIPYCFDLFMPAFLFSMRHPRPARVLTDARESTSAAAELPSRSGGWRGQSCHLVAMHSAARPPAADAHPPSSVSQADWSRHVAPGRLLTIAEVRAQHRRGDPLPTAVRIVGQ